MEAQPVKKPRTQKSPKAPREAKESKKPKASKLPYVLLLFTPTSVYRAHLTPEKAAADRNALQALGMSVSKKNLDTMNAKKTIVKEMTKKRRLAEMETTIATLEEKANISFVLSHFYSLTLGEERKR